MEKNNKNLNVPNLRFPEFSGEWDNGTLQSVATLSKGTGISKDQLSEEGQPCILYGELYTKYRSEIIDTIISKTDIDPKKLVTSQSNDVIIPCSGESAVDIATARCVKQSNILLGGDLNIIRLKGEHDGSFFAYQLNGRRKYDIAKVAQGVSVVHLYGEHLKRVKVNYPSAAEQKKISSLLALIDQRIETQKKIIEKYESLIRGLYHSVFNRQASTMRLKDVVSVVKGKQVNGEELLEHGKYYVMNGGTEPSGYLDACNTPANTISISEGGNSCGYVQYNTEPFWSGGHCYSLIQKGQSVNYQYLYHFLKYKERDIMALRIGSGLPNVQKKDLEIFEIRVLPTKQQNRVADILEDVSAKCDLEKRILQRWQCQKSYLLRNLFI